MCPGGPAWEGRPLYFETPVNLWNLWWFRHALVDLGRSPFSCPLLFHPNGANLWLHTLAPLHGLVGVALQTIGSLAAAQNVIILANLTAAGACTAALGRRFGLGRHGSAARRCHLCVLAGRLCASPRRALRAVGARLAAGGAALVPAARRGRAHARRCRARPRPCLCCLLLSVLWALRPRAARAVRVDLCSPAEGRVAPPVGHLRERCSGCDCATPARVLPQLGGRASARVGPGLRLVLRRPGRLLRARVHPSRAGCSAARPSRARRGRRTLGCLRRRRSSSAIPCSRSPRSVAGEAAGVRASCCPRPSCSSSGSSRSAPA